MLALVLFETRAAAAGGPDEQEALFRLRRDAVLALPGDHFPHVIQAADIICGAVDPDAAFEFALNLMIAGVEEAARAVSAVATAHGPPNSWSHPFTHASRNGR